VHVASSKRQQVSTSSKYRYVTSLFRDLTDSTTIAG
jgi:hypothetical protein